MDTEVKINNKSDFVNFVKDNGTTYLLDSESFEIREFLLLRDKEKYRLGEQRFPIESKFALCDENLLSLKDEPIEGQKLKVVHSRGLRSQTIDVTVTELMLKLSKLFLENLKSPLAWKELGIIDTQNTLSHLLLAGEIARRIPQATFYFSLGPSRGLLSSYLYTISRNSTMEKPTFLIIDNFEEHEHKYENIAGNNFYVILVSKSNFPYFRVESRGRNTPRHVFYVESASKKRKI